MTAPLSAERILAMNGATAALRRLFLKRSLAQITPGDMRRIFAHHAISDDERAFLATEHYENLISLSPKRDDGSLKPHNAVLIDRMYALMRGVD